MKTEFLNSAEKATLKIYDYVGKWYDANTQEIEEQLKEAERKPLDIYINSYGGEVFEGFAIYNILKRYEGYKTVYIDGIAASIASVIAMAGNKIVMNKASMFMIHNASGGCYGTFKEMEQVADALKKINETIREVYKEKVNLSDEKLTELMDNESYLKADECIEYGFADEIIEKEGEDKEVTNEVANQFMNQLDEKIKTLNSLKQYQSLVQSDFFIADKKEEKAEEPVNKLKKFFSKKEDR